MKTKALSGVILIVIIICIAGFSFWYRAGNKPVSASLNESVKKIVGDDSELKVEYDKALEDGILTLWEAQAIIDRAGEKNKAGRE